jgi:hypothetical protein
LQSFNVESYHTTYFAERVRNMKVILGSLLCFWATAAHAGDFWYNARIEAESTYDGLLRGLTAQQANRQADEIANGRYDEAGPPCLRVSLATPEIAPIILQECMRGYGWELYQDASQVSVSFSAALRDVIARRGRLPHQVCARTGILADFCE